MASLTFYSGLFYHVVRSDGVLKSTLGSVFINSTIDGATTKTQSKTNPGKGVINLCGTFKAWEPEH